MNLYVNDLPDGWSFIARRKDDTDEEWRTWTRFILFTISPWVLIHYVGAQIVDKFSIKVKYFYGNLRSYDAQSLIYN